MKRRQTPVVCVGLLLIFLATAPVYGQRGTIGVDVGQTADRFGALSRNTGVEGIIDGEVLVLPTKDTERGADVIAGGEIRLPSDTANHAKEFALYGGTAFRFGKGFSAGFHIQIHKIDLPPSGTVFFNHDSMELLELPGFLEYKFGPSRHAFVKAEGGREFSPRLHTSSAGANPLPNPHLDYGYTLRGSAGYVLGKWYVKATYESRYFKFRPIGNPEGLYNWRSDMVTGGVGFAF